MTELIEKEIADLVSITEKLASDAARSSSSLGQERVQELLSVSVRGGQLTSRLYGSDSHYMKMFNRTLNTNSFNMMHSNYCKHVGELAGLLKAVQHDVKSGMLSNLKNLLQAEIFSDFLEMAEHLLDEGYKDASAVMLGAVLEDSLRKIAESHGVPVLGPNGKPLTIDPINVALSKAGVYGSLVQKQVTTWANLRNDAAHGHFERYDKEQVKHMLFFVQKFCADYLK